MLFRSNVENFAKILKAKGAEAIHVSTCLFAHKIDGTWTLDNGGFCDKVDNLLDLMREVTALPCIKGTAHLPEGYIPKM